MFIENDDLRLMEETSKSRGTISHFGTCAVEVKSKIFDGAEEKRRGFIIEGEGCLRTIPFKKSTRPKRKPFEVSKTERGNTLQLSVGRQKLVLRIALDRVEDSEEQFRQEVDELLNDYKVKLWEVEVSECLD